MLAVHLVEHQMEIVEIHHHELLDLMSGQLLHVLGLICSNLF